MVALAVLVVLFLIDWRLGLGVMVLGGLALAALSLVGASFSPSRSLPGNPVTVMNAFATYPPPPPPPVAAENGNGGDEPAPAAVEEKQELKTDEETGIIR